MTFKPLLILLVLLSWVGSVKSQIYWRAADGRDSLQTNISFTADKVHNLQHEIHCQKGDSTFVLRPDHRVRGVRVQNKTFLSVFVTQPDGQIVRMFAHRVQAIEGMPVLFHLYDEQDKPRLFVQIQGRPLVSVSTSHVEPDDVLHRELIRLNDSVGGNPQIAHYLRELQPSRRNLWEASRIIERQNHNLIHRFRWGVGVGMAFSSLTATTEWVGNNIGQHPMTMTFDPHSQMQPTISLFADLPSFGGISMHPELTLRQGSLCQSLVWPSREQTDEIYNYTMLELPMLLRYTCVQLRGRWLPYAEAGAHFGYMLRSEHQRRAYVFDDDGYLSSLDLNTHQGDAVRFQPAVGAGVEYRYSERHAAFLGVRFVQTPEYLVDGELWVRQYAWMIHLSFNL